MSYRQVNHRGCISAKRRGGGGGFFLACEDLGRMFDNSFPACAFFFLFPKVEISSRTLFPLFARISPPWLSELRRMWPNAPCQVACELVFRISSHTKPEQQHSQPTPASGNETANHPTVCLLSPLLATALLRQVISTTTMC